MNNILEAVTIEQFKEYFCRDFPLLNYYDSNKVYKKNAEVYDEISDCFYKSLINNNTEDLEDLAAWSVVEDDKFNYILDEDIQKAMSQAILNGKVFGDNCNQAVTIYLHLIAYYLVVDITNSSNGINSKYNGLIQSKSVDGVSESYSIPTWMNNSPMYSMYAQNGYGLKYMSLIAPYLACTVLFSKGGTTIGWT